MKKRNILLVVLLVLLNIVCIQVFAIGRSGETVAPLLKPLQENTILDKEAMVPQDTVGVPLYTMCCFWMCWPRLGGGCDYVWHCMRIPGDQCYAEQTW